MGESFLDNAESDNILKIPILISELFNYPDDVIDKICLQAKQTSKKVCIIPFFSESEKEDEFYERIRFEKFFYENYDKLAEYKDKVYLEVRKNGYISYSAFDYFGLFVTHIPVYFDWQYEYISLQRLKEINDKIEMFTEDIKNSELSQFERTMAIYFICTQFIESYKGNSADVDTIDSSVMHILSHDDDGYKIQCAGYTDLFCRMAYECGIHTKEMAVGVGTSEIDYSDVPITNSDKFSASHSVAVVDLDDEKYGIHGSFICDVRTESDKARNNHNNPLSIFCLPFPDYNIYLSLSLKNIPNKQLDDSTNFYAINNKIIKGAEQKYLSDERIDISTIFVALQTVDEFIYGAISDTIVANEKETLLSVLRVRSFIDKNKPDVKDNVAVNEVSTDSSHK